jgi:hypothetical protein
MRHLIVSLSRGDDSSLVIRCRGLLISNLRNALVTSLVE